MNLSLEQIANATGGKLYGQNMMVTSLVTDSRKVQTGCIFAAIKGERADGFDFIPALDKTADICYLCERVPQNVSNPFVVVNNVIESIGKIANLHLNTLNAKHIAITGSVGKTTTKEFVRAALSQVMSVHAASGNFNNELGLPLTALQVTNSHQAVILEMGMRGVGQINYLCKIAKPDVAVITNIGISHIEILGSRENILKAKLEAVDNLSDNGVAILNGDDDMLSGVKCNKKTYFYGINNPNCDILATDVVDNSYTLNIGCKKYPVTLSVLGIHNIYNSLAAIAVGMALGFETEQLIKGVQSFTGDGNRQSIYDFGGIKFFDDTYNASPDSMKASLSVLKTLGGEKVIVVADMKELGDCSKSAHIGLKDAILECEPKCVVCIGQEMQNLYDVLNISNKFAVNSNDDALKILADVCKSGDTVFFKGSNSMNLAQLVQNFKKELQK